MDIEELLEKIDIEAPSGLVYFEQFADLMEEQADIPLETLFALAEGMDPAVLAELTGGYFEDILQSVPDDEDELYSLLYSVGTTLETLAGSGEEETIRLFTEEFYRFRSWYMFEPTVMCTDPAESSEQEMTLYEALTSHRAKNFTNEDFIYDFSNALSFQLDEYIISIGSMYDDDFDEDYDDEGDDEDAYAEPENDD
jgi:hypothetical protein